MPILRRSHSDFIQYVKKNRQNGKLSNFFILQFLHFQILTPWNHDAFQFWYFLNLKLSNSNTFESSHFPILTLSDSATFQIWHFPILTLSYSDTFQFWHFPILTPYNPCFVPEIMAVHIWIFAMKTIFDRSPFRRNYNSGSDLNNWWLKNTPLQSILYAYCNLTRNPVAIKPRIWSIFLIISLIVNLSLKPWSQN